MTTETETLNIRGLDEETVNFFRAAAGARGMSHAEYVTALVKLHQSMLELESGEYGYGLLEGAGLQAVRV